MGLECRYPWESPRRVPTYFALLSSALGHDWLLKSLVFTKFGMSMGLRPAGGSGQQREKFRSPRPDGRSTLSFWNLLHVSEVGLLLLIGSIPAPESAALAERGGLGNRETHVCVSLKVHVMSLVAGWLGSAVPTNSNFS